MAYTLSRIDRIYRNVDVGAALSDGTPVNLTALTVTLLTPRTTPAAATTWTAATQVAGVYRLVTAAGALTSTHATFAEALTAWGTAAAGSRIESRWRVLLAGPDADPTGAVVVPSGGGDLWIKLADSPEIDAERVERVSVN